MKLNIIVLNNCLTGSDISNQGSYLGLGAVIDQEAVTMSYCNFWAESLNVCSFYLSVIKNISTMANSNINYKMLA